MKALWLGQAGFFFVTAGGVRIMIDPYLSDSCHKQNPKSFRRTPINEDCFSLRPDVMVFTHKHADHYDPETAERFLCADRPITVLSPASVWNEARKLGGSNNYVRFDRYSEWTCGDVCFAAVKAEHSDDSAIGVILKTEGKTYYLTGDTLFNTAIFQDLPETIDVVFLPINGVGNNMNAIDACRFAERIAAKKAVPLHYGMFDDLDPSVFSYPKALVLQPYQEIDL